MAGRRNSHANQNHNKSSVNGARGGSRGNNGNSGPGSGSGSGTGANRNTGGTPNWTPEEQAILEEGIFKYASLSPVNRYARIAMRLPHKTIRDVALRARWMNRKENKKSKKEDHPKKDKDKRERANECSLKSTTEQVASQSGVQSHPERVVSLDNDDDIPYTKIGGPTAELLAQNAQFFRQISLNFTSAQQVQDNISLFCQARDNITTIMNSVKDTPEPMRQMPAIPVKLNEELVSAILPQTNHHTHH